MKVTRPAWVAPSLGIGVYENAVTPEALEALERKTLRNTLQDNLFFMHEKTFCTATQGAKKHRNGMFLFSFFNENQKNKALYLDELEVQEFIWTHAADAFLFSMLSGRTKVLRSMRVSAFSSDEELQERINALKSFEAYQMFRKGPRL